MDLESIEQWQTHPVTVWWMKQIDTEREGLKEMWGNGRFYDPNSPDYTSMMNANQVGYMEGLNFCTTLLMEGDDDS